MRVIKSAALLLCVISSVFAEPPVSGGYPSSRSSEHDYHDHGAEQRSLSSEYGPPSPSSRSSSQGSSRGYSPPTARVSFTQRFPSPAGRSQGSQHAPAARTLSQHSPDFRTPSQDYGTPVVAARNQNFNQKTSRSQFQDSYSQNAGSFSRNAPSSTYGAPSSRLSSSYGVPSARDSDSYSQDNSVSTTYGAPSQRLSDTYGAPSARGLAREYGAPASRSALKTDAIASSYASARSRSSPSSSYLPASRSSMPSQQYGVPEDNQGYEAAKARALDELLKQAPANYDFSYQIEDSESGGDFGHAETRLEDRAEGSYFVVLPDGTKQTVEYSADEDGFKPRISVEPLGGYDANAQDAAGPY